MEQSFKIVIDIDEVLDRLTGLLTRSNEIMSAISDFVVKQNAFNTTQAADIDKLVASNAGIAADVAALNSKILELQNSAGAVTPADQALLDQLEVSGAVLVAKTKAAADAAKALDDQTPPAVPVEPGGGGVVGQV